MFLFKVAEEIYSMSRVLVAGRQCSCLADGFDCFRLPQSPFQQLLRASMLWAWSIHAGQFGFSRHMFKMHLDYQTSEGTCHRRSKLHWHRMHGKCIYEMGGLSISLYTCTQLPNELLPNPYWSPLSPRLYMAIPLTLKSWNRFTIRRPKSPRLGRLSGIASQPPRNSYRARRNA